MNDLVSQMIKDLETLRDELMAAQQTERNKAAYKRCRKMTIDLAKEFKKFRELSIMEAKKNG